MKVLINAGFYRYVPLRGKGHKKTEYKSVQGMEFDVATARQITPKMVMKHEKAPPGKDGWMLQGYCEPESNERKV